MKPSPTSQTKAQKSSLPPAPGPRTLPPTQTPSSMPYSQARKTRCVSHFHPCPPHADCAVAPHLVPAVHATTPPVPPPPLCHHLCHLHATWYTCKDMNTHTYVHTQ